MKTKQQLHDKICVVDTHERGKKTSDEIRCDE